MIDIRHGDSRDVLKTLADNSVDSVVCDPPYALVSIVKRFGKEGAAPAIGNEAYARASAGFMGQQWDTGETAFAVEFWAEVMRVLKPGGHVVAFSGTRTYHRLAVAIEDAGFEIRDMLQYLYGSGFPKSHSVDKSAGDRICSCSPPEHDLRHLPEPDVSPPIDAQDERGEILQPGLPEPGAPPEKRGQLPAAKVRSGKSSVERRSDAAATPGKLRERSLREMPVGPDGDGEARRLRDGASAGHGAVGGSGADEDGNGSPQRSQAAEQPTLELGALAGQPQPQTGGAWPVCRGCGKPRVVRGLGTALKPACEPIVLARKPLAGTVVGNVLAHGTGALNIDGCRVDSGDIWGSSGVDSGGKSVAVLGDGLNNSGRSGAHALGRWPANVAHDGSDEVLSLFPDTASGGYPPEGGMRSHGSTYGEPNARWEQKFTGSDGSAARFFYTAKADATDRLGSKHPTVKPTDLMRWLCRLVTPPGGLVLDPFAGSGSTGVAAVFEGFDAILIEREPEYVDDIRRRIAWAQGDGRLTILEKKRPTQKEPMEGDLF